MVFGLGGVLPSDRAAVLAEAKSAAGMARSADKKAELRTGRGKSS